MKPPFKPCCGVIKNKGSARSLAAMYAEDAQSTSEDGNMVSGREAIAGRSKGYFKSPKEPKLSIEIQSARFLTPDVAETPVPQPPMEGQSPRNGFLSLGPHATR